MYLPNSLYASAGDGPHCVRHLTAPTLTPLSCRNGRWKVKGGKQMAQYNLGVPSFRIHQIRSLLKDTLAASMSLRLFRRACFTRTWMSLIQLRIYLMGVQYRGVSSSSMPVMLIIVCL